MLSEPYKSENIAVAQCSKKLLWCYYNRIRNVAPKLIQIDSRKCCSESTTKWVGKEKLCNNKISLLTQIDEGPEPSSAE